MSARKQRLLISLIAFCPALFSEIVVDGLLDEEEWATAKEVNKFYEVYPYVGNCHVSQLFYSNEVR